MLAKGSSLSGRGAADGRGARPSLLDASAKVA